jgi:hypothetical protein
VESWLQGVKGAKDVNYLKAARALLLVELLYNYQGAGSVGDFLTKKKNATLPFLGVVTEECGSNPLD